MSQVPFRIRRAEVGDVAELAPLVLASGHAFSAVWGPRAELLLRHLLPCPANLYSATHTTVAADDDRVAGMLLSYDSITQAREGADTLRLIKSFLGFEYHLRVLGLRKVHHALGSLEPNEYLIANIAVAPNVRRAGVGALLIREALNRARSAEAASLVLHVLSDNETAVAFYRQQGFVVTAEAPVFRLGRERFAYLKMALSVGGR